MPQSTIEVVKAYSAPALLAVILVLCGLLWSGTQQRISSLEQQLATTSSTVQVIAVTQQASKEDRALFQDATTARLNQMADLLSTLNDAVVRLSALQEKEVAQ